MPGTWNDPLPFGPDFYNPQRTPIRVIHLVHLHTGKFLAFGYGLSQEWPEPPSTGEPWRFRLNSFSTPEARLWTPPAPACNTGAMRTEHRTTEVPMTRSTRNRAVVLSMALAAALSTLAPAQPIFFDDFNGPTLDPRWVFGMPFDYTLTGGRMTVTRLHGRYPEPPPHGPDYTYGDFAVSLPALMDFRVTVDLGWAAGGGRRLYLTLTSPGGLVESEMYLSEFAEFGVLFSRGIGPVGRVPIPPPGPHRFTLIRQAGQFRWELDDVLLGQLPDVFGDAVTRLNIAFNGPWSGLPAPMWLDTVLVVPPPNSLAVLALGLGVHSRRRRSICPVVGKDSSMRRSGVLPGARRTSWPSTCATCTRGRS